MVPSPTLHRQFLAAAKRRGVPPALPYRRHRPHKSVVTVVPPPTRQQLRAHFIATAVPMMGFGLMDQTIMIQAGNTIDCTVGVALGLSTLSAAAIGQLVANAGSVVFGGVVERAAQALGMPSPHFLPHQRSLPVVHRVGMC